MSFCSSILTLSPIQVGQKLIFSISFSGMVIAIRQNFGTEKNDPFWAANDEWAGKDSGGLS